MCHLSFVSPSIGRCLWWDSVSSVTAVMEQEQTSDGMPRRRSAVRSTNRSSKSDGVAENMINIPHETTNRGAESEKIEVQPHKKNIHCFNGCNSFQNIERTICRWSKEEDEQLTQMVNKYGTKSWQTISCSIPNRTPHACLSRWKYILDPQINKEAWSQQDELRLIRAHQIYGNKWREMVKHFPGRTNNALKEHWRGPMKRKLDSYLTSGLFEQVPDLHENLAVPQSSQSDIPEDTRVSSDSNRLLSALSTNSKREQELTELGENADTSEGECSDFINAEALDAHSAKSQQCVRATKKLDFLSTKVELKSDVSHETAKKCQIMESEKTDQLCKKNAQSLKESSLKISERTKGRWLAEEDELLTQMVSKHGWKNWKNIASAIPGRNVRQCQIRWTRNLDPAINKEAWSEQEELKLIRAHQIYGSQWLKMVKHFPGRTNHALKEHWRGRMKGKLNSYLASGLLKQVPDLHEDLSDPDSSQPDIPKDNQGSYGAKRPPSVLPKRPKHKQETSELGKSADTSEEESSDHINHEGLDACSAQVSERIRAKSKQRARARRKLDFLSTPVELKVCASGSSSGRPLPKMEQLSPVISNSSPSDAFKVNTDIPTAASNHPNVRMSETPDPFSLDQHEAIASDLLDMSYCDDLMIDSPSYQHDDFV